MVSFHPASILKPARCLFLYFFISHATLFGKWNSQGGTIVVESLKNGKRFHQPSSQTLQFQNEVKTQETKIIAFEGTQVQTRLTEADESSIFCKISRSDDVFDYTNGGSFEPDACRVSGEHGGKKYHHVDTNDDKFGFHPFLHYPMGLFNCSSCLCQNSKTGRKVHADCVDKRFDSIITDLPLNIISLNISWNNLKDVNIDNIITYRYLTELYARNSGIERIMSAEVNGRSATVVTLDLSFNRIQTFTDGIFKIFPNLTQLLMRGNNIEHVHNNSFSGLKRLKMLDLSINKIHTIDIAAFNHFPMLRILYLSINDHMGYNETELPPILFQNLKCLKSLHIQGSSNGANDYPNKVIGELKNLEELNIDALAEPAEFGQEFESLKHLRILKFGPYPKCTLVNMSRSFYQYFPHLECLQFYGCNIDNFNHSAYASLVKLQALTLQDVPLMTLDDAFQHLSGFSETSSLTYIGFIHLVKWKWPCIWMDFETGGKYLTRFNLTTINLSENRISLLTEGFLHAMPKSVETLILAWNKFTLINPFWTHLHNFTNLTYLDASNQNMEDNKFDFGTGQGVVDSKTTMTMKRPLKEIVSLHNLADTPNFIPAIDIDTDIILNLPANLRTVKASGYNFFGNILLRHPEGKNSLENVNFSQSSLRYWGNGNIPPGVRILDLGYNDCKLIKDNFFKPNNSLLQLHLQFNLLGDFIGGSDGNLMQHMNKLKYLDLSANAIYSIPFEFFDALEEVEAINLSINRMEVLNVSLKNTRALTFLYLQSNSISLISEITRRDLDTLAKRPSGMLIDLHFNYLRCDCDSIDMLQWMRDTRVYFMNQGLYQCRDNENKILNITRRQLMHQQLIILQRYCGYKGYLLFICLGCSFCIFLTVFLVVIYRKRWLIRYKYEVFYAKWFGFKPAQETNDSGLYRYDAFLIYTEEDLQFASKCCNELEKKRHHKLCIGDRDILPGTNELAAIVSAIQHSRITLVAVTDNFVHSMRKCFRENPMLHYALQMAVMEEYCKNRKTLHMLLYHNCEDVKYPPYLLKVFSDNCLTDFQPFVVNAEEDEADATRETFWNKLSLTIGHTNGTFNEDQEDVLSYYSYSQDDNNK